ncbi:MAG: hypothetical protein QFX35_06760 [Candidatus Verstraetearchaeota archaeon]|nr:hypothetical protein [Candidatus Verstraetearchaeota archaeon]
MWRLLRPDAVDALDDPRVLSAMPRYARVAKGTLPARFLISRSISADWDPQGSLEELWQVHNRSLSEAESLMRRIDSGGMDSRELNREPRSLLHLKARIGEALMESCVLCERRCGKNRLNGELGLCRVGRETKIHSCFDHMGEEPEVVPSFTVCGS